MTIHVEEDDALSDNILSTPRRLVGKQYNLRSDALAHPKAFAELVACAEWEAINSFRNGQSDDAINVPVANKFNACAWEWVDINTNGDNVRVWYAYKWLDPDDKSGKTRRRGLANMSLNQALKSYTLRAALPSELTSRNVESALKAIAATTTELFKAPCAYLGVSLGRLGSKPEDGPFDSACGRYGTNADVWFEWQHVTIGGTHGTPHRVSIRADEILHGSEGQRFIPGNPLRASPPTKLRLSTQFMDQIANNVKDGVRFLGIVVQGEWGNLIKE